MSPATLPALCSTHPATSRRIRTVFQQGSDAGIDSGMSNTAATGLGCNAHGTEQDTVPTPPSHRASLWSKLTKLSSNIGSRASQAKSTLANLATAARSHLPTSPSAAFNSAFDGLSKIITAGVVDQALSTVLPSAYTNVPWAARVGAIRLASGYAPSSFKRQLDLVASAANFDNAASAAFGTRYSGAASDGIRKSIAMGLTSARMGV